MTNIEKVEKIRSILKEAGPKENLTKEEIKETMCEIFLDDLVDEMYEIYTILHNIDNIIKEVTE